MRRVENAALLVAMLIQLRLWATGEGVAGRRGHAWEAAVLALRCAWLAVSVLLPHAAWVRWRVPLITLARASPASATQGPGVLLDGPATPGIIGALRDWLRGIIGTRLLLPAVIAASLHQPPLAVLAQQLLHLYLAVDVRGACAAPLLRDPLSLRRLGGAWELLDAASVMGVPLASAISTHQGAQGDEARCHAVVAFHVQLIALLPVAVAARASQQPQQQEPDLPPVARHGGGAAGLARRGLQHVAQACCQLDAQLGSVFRGGGMLPLQCCVVAYLAVGNMWLLAKALS